MQLKVPKPLFCLLHQAALISPSISLGLSRSLCQPPSVSVFPAPSSISLSFLCLSLLACLSVSLSLSLCVSLSLAHLFFNNHNNEKSSFPTLLGRETKGGEPGEEGEG